MTPFTFATGRRYVAVMAAALAFALLLIIARGAATAAPQQRPENGRAGILDRFPPESLWHDATPLALWSPAP